jgi:hypothetical protein
MLHRDMRQREIERQAAGADASTPQRSRSPNGPSSGSAVSGPLPRPAGVAWSTRAEDESSDGCSLWRSLIVRDKETQRSPFIGSSIRSRSTNPKGDQHETHHLQDTGNPCRTRSHHAFNLCFLDSTDQPVRHSARGTTV